MTSQTKVQLPRVLQEIINEAWAYDRANDKVTVWQMQNLIRQNLYGRITTVHLGLLVQVFPETLEIQQALVKGDVVVEDSNRQDLPANKSIAIANNVLARVKALQNPKFPRTQLKQEKDED